MIPNYENYRTILVTGAQRSGTTIASRIIAYDTGYKCIDEDDYGTKDVDKWRALVDAESQAVIQCPSMSAFVHEVGNPDVLVVFVKRPLSEVIASQDRIGWDQEQDERNKYRELIGKGNRYLSKPIGELKLHAWNAHQKALIRHYKEINYHDLSGHRLWIPKTKRANFTARQWNLTGE